MSTTSIEWTERTWNPTTGCDRVSPGCDHCYALTMAKRLKAMGAAKYQNDGNPRTSGPGFGITEHSSVLEQPLRRRKPTRYFVNSMSDLFHDGVSDGFIGSVFEVMAKTPWHTYQILTKRHGRMRSLLQRWAAEGARHDWAGPGTAVFRRADMHWVGPIRWPLPNVWLGVSVEDQRRADLRIPVLLDTPAAVRWLSCEPLLGPVALNPRWLHDLHWIVVGGESGPGARPPHPMWFRSLRDQCVGSETSFFMKQWGDWAPRRPVAWPVTNLAPDPQRQRWVRVDGDSIAPDEFTGGPADRDGHPMFRVGKSTSGRELDGRTWDQYPQAVET